MKRNRGGEQDLDHIIAAAVRGMDRAMLEYPQVRAGLIFCLDRGFSRELNEIIAAKAISWPAGASWRSTSPVPVAPRSASPTTATSSPSARARAGLTVHAGETAGRGRCGRRSRRSSRTASVTGSGARYDPS